MRKTQPRLCKSHKGAHRYTLCPLCACEYCPETYTRCPRTSWHPSHGETDAEIARRYRESRTEAFHDDSEHKREQIS